MNYTPIVMGVPKPTRKKKTSKVREWANVRRELKVMFRDMGITSCELGLVGCTPNSFLGFAHTAKRRKLNHEQLYEVALLCQSCHYAIEYCATPEIMEHTIKGLIEKR